MIHSNFCTSEGRKGRILALVPLMGAFAVPAHAQTPAPVYQNSKAPLESRVTDLISRLTPDEKISLLAGTQFTTKPIPRLGIPPAGMADAGQGVRGGMKSTLGPATAFPSGVAMASTWNPTLIGQVGAAIGTEAQNKGTGIQIMLGPAVNIQRSPLGGRNGEYFSEDPFLAGRLAVGYIKGMQGTGTVACIKHFAANNEESDRFNVNVQVSERALREIYLPAFEAGVKDGGVWTVMSSYNSLNGPHASANGYLLTDILKRCWGFDGMVMSDWGGVHDAAPTINAGNDLEMPDRGFLAPAKVRDALARGLVTQAQIDANVTRIVRTILRSGVVDGVKTPNPALVNSDANREVALRAAQEGIVLLKNERQMLPLDATKIHSIALIGPAARSLQVGAGGSPSVTPLRSVGPLEGLQNRVGKGVQVRYVAGDTNGIQFPAGTLKAPTGEAGFRAEVFAGKNLEGTPTATRIDPQIDFSLGLTGMGTDVYSVRWTSTFTPRKSGATQFLFRADDGCRLFLDDKLIIDEWKDSGATTHSATVNLEAGHAYTLRAEYYQSGGNAAAQLRIIEPNSTPFAEVVEAAKQSDVAIVVVTTRGTEGEGQDRPSMALPEGQDELIRQVVAANPKTIVVLNNGTPVSMPWLQSVPALVEAWFPGQEGGRALAQVLFGDVNPSGHLPTTLGARREDYPDYGNFPGKNGQVHYEEGIYVGYRGFDKKNITPLFPFGYGLSYTTFRIDNLKLSSPTLAANGHLTVQVRVTNTGKRAGAQVVQLYVSDPNPKVDRPVRELKGFAKVFLQAGQSQIATIALSPRDFAWCDVKTKGWRADAGNYEIEVGDSSRNLTQKATVQLANYFESIPFMRDETALPAIATLPMSTLPAPVQMTAEQDHQKMMDLLGITTLRPGANSRDPQSPNAVVYDEAKVKPYPNLPDPLVLKNGQKVTTAAMWWNQRRPEIVEDFDREIYGRAPQNTPKVTWEVTSTTNETNGDVPVITKQLVGHVDNAAYPLVKVDIQLTLTTPANATGPVPVMMQFGSGRGLWQQQVLAKGWGCAVITPGSIQADNGAGLTQGIIGLVNKGQPRKPDDWGALRAWAWGASRALDYFETDKAVDAKQVGLEGHSRFGKATLVAMAYDPRFAIAYVSSSGEGGAKIHRRNFGELVENVAAPNEYHWMAGNFLKYAGPLTPNDLPIDSHELIALCAPRPVFLGVGAEGDNWADAKGTFLAAVGAGPVYKLLGKQDLGATELPPVETALIDGDLAFRQHSGGHTDAPNWPTFLTFASRILKGAPLTTAAAKAP